METNPSTFMGFEPKYSWAIPQLPYDFLETLLMQLSVTIENFKCYFRSAEIRKDICPTSVKIGIFKSFHKYLQIPIVSLVYFSELHIKQVI